ncbi:MAG TPA: diguanylate cyclase [Candidatus Hydrogenedentes bacterium]|nr:diguanylate cyclase [Candidatus Hydrogenedentota bacterium]HOL75644.1 diguanylate cyclase [Candidatus Hydrogenedentota bacterium]HPO84363.1 diguanylate cyclase [Candidatus Hydrogenedentota bacterium]
MEERILILDDEESIVELLGNYLTSKGYQCTLTTSPFDALEILKEQKHALLLTDLRMPKMSGIEVVRLAKEIDPDLAVVVVTALMEIGNAVQAMRVGADDYVLKPFNLSEISLSVSRAFEKRRLIIENREYQQNLAKRVEEATRNLERVNSELQATKKYLENLLNSTVDAIITIDLDGKINYANMGALRMLGYKQEEMVGMPAENLFAAGLNELNYIERVLHQGRALQNYESELVRADGSTVPVSMSVSHVPDADNKIVATLAICKDITEQKKLEQELKEMSIKDSLTGLYNQGYFYDRLQAEIERAKRQGHPLSLLLFDVDNFKSYNDSRGHLEGDRVLKTLARVVRESTRNSVDIAFRYGGDEFTVILPEADEEQAKVIAERIRKGFEAHHFDNLTLSIGLMSYREGYSLRSFIQFTDAVMYDAKRAGGNQVYVYNPDEAAPKTAKPENRKRGNVTHD